jgi:sigma-B regulation protein RsbU (phosphoserine phosphatase)
VEYPAETVTLSPGDRVLAYSDGVEDACNEAGEAFGRKRLRSALESTRGLGLAAAHDLVKSAVTAHVGRAQPADDLTLLLIEYAGAQGPA